MYNFVNQKKKNLKNGYLRYYLIRSISISHLLWRDETLGNLICVTFLCDA